MTSHRNRLVSKNIHNHHQLLLSQSFCRWKAHIRIKRIVRANEQKLGQLAEEKLKEQERIEQEKMNQKNEMEQTLKSLEDKMSKIESERIRIEQENRERITLARFSQETQTQEEEEITTKLSDISLIKEKGKNDNGQHNENLTPLLHEHYHHYLSPSPSSSSVSSSPLTFSNPSSLTMTLSPASKHPIPAASLITSLLSLASLNPATNEQDEKITKQMQVLSLEINIPSYPMFPTCGSHSYSCSFCSLCADVIIVETRIY